MTTLSPSQIEQWPIDKFVPYARNPRKNDAAIDRMASSIQSAGLGAEQRRF